MVSQKFLNMSVAPKNNKTAPATRQHKPFFGNANSFSGNTTAPANHFFRGGVSPSGNLVQRAPAPAAGTPDPVWANFAVDFNEAFKSILHVFNTAWPPDKKNNAPGTQSADSLDEAQLQQLFSVTQRDKLMQFFATKQIPDLLFNGDETGNATAQQRLLMAAHILSTGTYQPGSFEQKVHARMCFHWIRILHHYAGTTTVDLSKGIMGNFDHAGNIILATGKSHDVFMGSKVQADMLPETEDGDIGPIPEDTPHLEALQKEDALLAENPKAGRKIHRRRTFPFEEFDKIQPGDWVWYYNANASDSGSHSVIFSRWASGDEIIDGIRYRRAIAFSQPKPERGGREHVVYLGEQPHRSGNIIINPITYLNRIPASSHPAKTVEEFLPKGGTKAEAVLNTKNDKFLKKAAKKYKKPSIDPQLVIDHLQQENKDTILTLSHRMTSRQRALLEEANRTTDMETLVRLTQKLRSLKKNTDIYEANMDKTFEGNLNEKHATALVKLEEKEEGINTKLEEIELELTTTAADIENIADEIKDKDLKPAIDDLKERSGTIKRKLNKLKRNDPERETLKNDIDELTKQLKDLEAKAKALKPELNELRSQTTKLTKQRKKLELNRQKLNVELWKAKAALPFGLVHPGNLGKEDKGKVSGVLEQVLNMKQMEQFAK